MLSFGYRLRTGFVVLLMLMLLCALPACTGNGGTNNGEPHPSLTITISGQHSIEGQLLTKLYALLLQHAGINIVERTVPDTNGAIFNAMTSGQIDLYPEFTAIGMAKLNLYSTGNERLDYLQIKQGYEARYQVTWLDLSSLNDAYGICTTRTRANSLGARKISDLAGKTSMLTIATPPDGVQQGVNLVKSIYSLAFKKVVTYKEDNQTFLAVNAGTQDLNICSTSSADIVRYKFVLLQDDKSAFPINTPAPVVRDSILKKMPQVAITLNKLAPYLTTQVIQQLQFEVVNEGQNVTEAATRFLQSKGLL